MLWNYFNFWILLLLYGNVYGIKYKWSRLNTGIAHSTSLKELPPKIMNGLNEAIVSLNKFIYVRIDYNDPMKISHDRIKKCTKNDDFLNDYLLLEKFVKKHSMRKVKISNNGLNLKKFGINFVLFISVDTEVCQKDPFMLAGASPCMDPNGKLETIVPRPICGKLIICLKSLSWKSFESSYDLFRHEIMHALGFGTIIPDKYSNTTKSMVKYWNNNVDRIPQRYTSHYMDFASKATIAAKKYFKCNDLIGIEAEDEEKIHLSEYIYGNELMTPVISNGPNFFTYISAMILEETHLGKIQWYKTNKTSVKKESLKYWYGRSWGCTFALRSCYEFISKTLSTNRGNSFPFCNEYELRYFLYTRKPHKVCFSNEHETTVIYVTCNLMKKLVQPIGQFMPKPLISQYPTLRHLLDPIGFPVYGSDSFHHYCPMVKEFVEDEIKHLPPNSEIVPCF